MEVVDGVAERCDLVIQEEAQVRSAIQGNRSQIEVVRREAELAAQRRSDGSVVLNVHVELRAGENAGVKIFQRSDVDRGGDVVRRRGDAVTAVEEFEGPSGDVEVTEVEMVD